MNPPVAELTVEETAEGIAIRHAGPTARERFDLTAEIEAALKARDERLVNAIKDLREGTTERFAYGGYSRELWHLNVETRNAVCDELLKKIKK